jgi:hypothetical protein
MRRSLRLGCLQCSRNLRVRGREQPGYLLGQRLVGSQGRQLALPEIQITPGQPIEIARLAIGGRASRGICLVSHDGIIAHRSSLCSHTQTAPLSHCGIGAKVFAKW